MTKLDGQEPDDFISDLMSRYEAFLRNKVPDKRTGQELIIPVSENAKVREELQRMIDELCAFYLLVSDEERDHIRKLVQENRPLHNGLLAHIGWTLQHKSFDWVQRGLAGASIEDNREDFRDMFIALGGLYLEASRDGIDASGRFQKAAQLSTPSMRRFLLDFEKSEYFKQAVLPNLPRT